MSSSVGQYLALVLYALPGLIIGFVLHELAHAFVAVRLGDPTPRRLGRITLNPREHIDPVGLGMLLTVGFGWAKPVTFSTAYIRTGLQQAMVAAAGPLTNLVLAGVFAGLLHVVLAVSPEAPLHVFDGLTPDGRISFGHGGADAVTYWFLNEAFFVNVVLFVFNSIPIPGLDGYAVARGLLGRHMPGLFHAMEANRQLIWGLALIVLFILPQMGNGGVNPLTHIIDSTDNFLYRTFVDSGGTALPAGLPNITLLFNG
ncbi:MAG TPA: site-2 protease family protein [Candidatus Dormibacteraeota bacterium]|nr:site-2 protease family protein [Candidatus Dormibacteraeota bacterium]